MLVKGSSLQLLLLYSLTLITAQGELIISTREGHIITDGKYFATEGLLEFSCSSSKGFNTSWYYRDPLGVEIVPENSTAWIYQVTNLTGQVLYVNWTNSTRDEILDLICESAGGNATLVVSQDIIQSVRAVNSTSILLTWEPNRYPGYLSIEYCLVYPDLESPCPNAITVFDNDLDHSHYINGVMPFATYQVSISGHSNKRKVTTPQASPSGVPQNITFTFEQPNLGISWHIPSLKERNGVITHYVIACNDSSTRDIMQNFTLSSYNFSHPEFVSATISIKNLSNHQCKVAAGTSVGLGPFSDQDLTIKRLKLTSESDESSQVTVEWASMGPYGVDHSVTVEYRLHREHSSNTTFTSENVVNKTMSSVRINLDPGKPYEVFVTLEISEVWYIGSTVLFSKELSPKTAVESFTAKAVNATHARLHWKTLTLEQARGHPMYQVSLSADGGLETVLNVSNSPIVVGNLTSTQYIVRVVAFTKGGKGPEAEVSLMMPSDQPSVTIATVPTVIIGLGTGVGLLVVIVLVLIIATVIIFCKLRCKSSLNRKHEENSEDAVLFKKSEDTGVVVMMDGSPFTKKSNYARATISHSASIDSLYVNDTLAKKLTTSTSRNVSYVNVKPPIPVAEFATHVSKMKTKKGFQTEYESLPLIDNHVSNSAAQFNVVKNRYKQIIPYDRSRVILSGDSSADYINASFIKGYNGEITYIATQGPLGCTIGDFWRMVWEQRSPVIVMLTRLQEGGKVKCEKYWNDEIYQPIQLNNGINLTLDETKIFSEYQLRTFIIRNVNEPASETRVVHHFHYTAWPDYGVPHHPGSLLRFIQSVNHCRSPHEGKDNPIIVHCSAGVGRTGTYIAIDAMMQRLKEKDDLNVFEYLLSMRGDRPFMVFNLDQYIFVHEALCDYTVSGDTSIDASSFKEAVERLRAPDRVRGISGFDFQFQCLEKLSRKPNQMDEQLAGNNTNFNRYDSRFPYVTNFLSIKTNVRSTYINASSVNSYSRQGAFIAAQYPLQATVEHLLEVIYQKKCKTCVVLCHNEELIPSNVSFSVFWPTSHIKAMKYGRYEIFLDEAMPKNEYSVLKLIMKSSSKADDLPHEFTLIHCSQWLEVGEITPSSVLSVINEYERAQQGVNSPTVVMCNDGMGRTGAFICMCSEIERIKMEAISDVFQSVKAARNQRPYMVSTVEQYVLIHEVLASFMATFQTYNNFKC